MINLGVALAKPYESTYAKFRRFLIVNKDIDLTSQKLSRLMTEKYDINRAVKIPNNQKTLKLAKIHRLIEEKIAKSSKYSTLDTYELSDHIHKELKCCPECAKAGYHNELMNLEWMKTCPIHKVEITKTCPDCQNQWPTMAQLKKVKCKTCGANSSINALKNSTVTNGQYKVFKLIRKTVSKVQKATKIHQIYKDLEGYIIFLKQTKALRNSNNPMLFTFARQLKLISRNDVKKLKSAGVNFYKVNSVKSFIDNKVSKILDVNELFDKSGFVTIEDKSTKRIKHFLECHSVHKPNHELGTCDFLNKSCVCCSTWHFWNTLVDRSYKFMTAKNTMFTGVELLGYFVFPKSFAELIFHRPKTTRREIYYYKMKNLPHNIQLKLYEIELWCLAMAAYIYIEKFIELTAGKNNITWCEIHESLEAKVRGFAREVPVSVYIDFKHEKLVYPSIIESKTFF